MNDFKIKAVKIKLDRDRTLIYDLNAFEELEELYGDIGTALELFSTDVKKIKHIKNYLFAGLVHEDATLTPSIIGKMISHTNLTYVVNTIWEAITQSLPDTKDGVERQAGE